MSAAPEIMTAAFRYIDRGFAIVPAKADKKPLGENWRRRFPKQELLNSLHDDECAAIGFLGGDLNDNIVPLDFDSAAGEAWWRAQCEAAGIDPDDFPTVITPGRIKDGKRTPGRHRYVHDTRKTLTNAQGPLLKALGIDIRGKGHAMLPPSPHPEGGLYRWLDRHSFDEFETIPPCPSFFYDAIAAKPHQSNGAHRPITADERERRYAAAALAAECHKVATAPSGVRNATLNNAALAMGHQVAAGRIGRRQVEAALLESAEACGLVGEDGEHACRATIKSGRDKGETEPAKPLEDREAIVTHAQQSDDPRTDVPPVGEEENIVLPPEYSEDRLALLFADRHANDLRYVAAWGKWLSWTGTHWRFDETHESFDHARLVCRDVANGCNKKSVAKAITSAKTVAAVLILARSDRRIAATSEQWDSDPWLLSTPSGVIDLRTGQERPHMPEDYMTKITGIGMDAECPTPYWTAFLDRVTGGDAALQAFLSRVIGYSLTGITREHALFFLFGIGANGKSTFLNTISKAMGDYARSAPIETFTVSHNDRHPTELAGLRGARLVTAIETERGRQWAESRIKALTGGDTIAARFMRQDFFEFMPQFKLVIAGNHKPGLRSVDEAIRRRFNLVPFTVTIPPQERDPDLPERLAAELPGILAWAVQGCLDWQERGLAAPEAVTNATAEYLQGEDATQLWMDEKCFVGERNAQAKSSELYRSWKDWAERAGEHPGTMKAFSQTLQNRGFAIAHSRTGSAFLGLRLIPEMTADER